MSASNTAIIQLIYILIIIPLSISTSKFALIQPSNPSHDGISTTLIDGVSISNNKWHLFTTNEDKFNLHISLDTTWSFDSTDSSTLQFQIDNDHHPEQPTSILIVFSQNNKYFTFILDIDEHYIYPPPLQDSISSFADGDIDSIINTESDTWNRTDRVTNDGNYELIPNITDIAYPLVFTFTNQPSSKTMAFTYSNPTINDYDVLWEQMEANSPFDIYVSVLDQDSKLDISSFSFMYSGPNNPDISTTLSLSGIAIPSNNNNVTLSATAAEIINDNDNREDFVTDSDNSGGTGWVYDTLHIILIASLGVFCCICILFAVLFLKMYQYQKAKYLKNSSMHPKDVGPAEDSKERMKMNSKSGKDHMEIIHIPNLPTAHQLSAGHIMVPSFTFDHGSQPSMTSNASNSMYNIQIEHINEEKECAVSDFQLSDHELPSPLPNYRPRLGTGEAHHDLEMTSEHIEALYDNPSEEDIRKATIDDPSTPTGPQHYRQHNRDLSELIRGSPHLMKSAGANRSGSHQKSKTVATTLGLVIEDNVNVNRISFVGDESVRTFKFGKENLALNQICSGDSEAIYGSGPVSVHDTPGNYLTPYGDDEAFAKHTEESDGEGSNC